MRRALALALLLPLAACDGGGPDDPVVGTWTLASFTSSLRVTSRTAQAVPDRSATPTGAVSVTGAVAAELGVVTDLFQTPTGFAVLQVASAGRETGADVTELSLNASATESQAQLTVEATGAQYVGVYDASPVFVRDGGRFAVPERVLTDGAGASVTVGGALAYPEIALEPGVATALQATEEEISDTLTLTFEADGSLETRAVGPGGTDRSAGTWERLGDGRLRLTVTDDEGETEVSVFTASVEGGALLLDTEEPFGADAEFRRQIEAEIFADAGSLSAVGFGATLRLVPARQAAARTAERPALRPRPAILDRLLL